MISKFREMFDETHEIIGWTGMVFILLAYGLLSSHVLLVDSLIYQWLNVLGSAALVYSSFKVNNFPLVGLNAIWILIAITSIMVSLS